MCIFYGITGCTSLLLFFKCQTHDLSKDVTSVSYMVSAALSGILRLILVPDQQFKAHR